MKTKILFILISISSTLFAQKNLSSLEESADSLYKLKEYNASIEIYDNLLAKKPNNSHYLLYKGLCFFNLGNYQKAKEYCRLAVLYANTNEKESLSNYYSNLSACYYQLSDVKKAYECAMKAYYLNEYNPLALWNAAGLASSIGEYKKGIEMLDKSKIEKHNDFNSLYGEIYLLSQEYDKSVEFFEKFFLNFDENERFVDIDLSVAKYRLLIAYMGVLTRNIENEVNENNYEQQMLNLTKELTGIEEINNLTSKHILEFLDSVKAKNNPFTDLFIKEFEMLPDRPLLESATFYYRVKQYKKSQEFVEKLIATDFYPSDSDEKSTKMYRYLNQLNIMLIHSKNRLNTVDDKELELTLSYFRSYYDVVDKLDYQGEYYNEELTTCIYETLLTLNSKSTYSQEKVKYVLDNIIENIPSEGMKKEILKIIKNTENK
jgi:tetratricopeptide (TPR) repeat protein